MPNRIASALLNFSLPSLRERCARFHSFRTHTQLEEKDKEVAIRGALSAQKYKLTCVFREGLLEEVTSVRF